MPCSHSVTKSLWSGPFGHDFTPSSRGKEATTCSLAGHLVVEQYRGAQRIHVTQLILVRRPASAASDTAQRTGKSVPCKVATNDFDGRLVHLNMAAAMLRSNSTDLQLPLEGAL